MYAVRGSFPLRTAHCAYFRLKKSWLPFRKAAARIKYLLERQEREIRAFDMESLRMGFGNLVTLDFPKEDYR